MTTAETEQPAPEAPPNRPSPDTIAIAICAFVGLILAIEPHLTMLLSHGTLVYFGDGDDVFYTTLARRPYHDGWTLIDPFRPASSPLPTLYSWLTFVPIAKLSAALGIDRLLLPMVWRALGGPMLGAAVYMLFRRLLSRTKQPVAWSLGCTIVCLADAGFVGGQTLYGGAGLIRAMARGDTPMSVPNGLGQFRVVTPLLNLPVLIALAAVLVPSEKSERRVLRTMLGILLLGLCVYLYFYFWTAAVLALVLCITAWIVLGGHAENDLARPDIASVMKRERNLLAAVLLGGLALGAPQIVNNARTFSDPALKSTLQRMNRGRPLMPADPARTRYLVNYWVFAKLGIGALAIFGLRAWRLAPVGAFVASGYLLANHAVVSGLEFENFHWAYVHAPFGEILALAAVALACDRLRAVPRSLAIVPAAVLALGLVWRPYEATHGREPLLYNQAVRDLLPLRPALARLGPDDVLSGPWQAGVAVMMGDSGLLYQYDQTLVSSLVSTIDAVQRKALSSWLDGLTLEQALESLSADENHVIGRIRGVRGELYTSLFAGTTAPGLLGRYRPTHLLRPTAAGPPLVERGGPWTLVESRASWSLWRR